MGLLPHFVGLLPHFVGLLPHFVGLLNVVLFDQLLTNRAGFFVQLLLFDLFVVGFPIGILGLFARIPLIHGSEIAHGTRPDLALGVAFGTFLVLSADIPVALADTESRGEGKVGKAKVFGYSFNQSPGCLVGRHSLAQKTVQDGTAGVFGLEQILPFESCEDIIRIAHGKLGAVGVVGNTGARAVEMVVELHVREQALVDPRQSVTGSLGRRRLEIEYISRLFLVIGKLLPHEIQNLYGKIDSFGLGHIVVTQVEQRLIHANDSNGGEVVFPVLTKGLLDVPQIDLAVGIESHLGEALEHLALDHQALFGRIHPCRKAFEELRLAVGFIARSWQIDRHNPDRAGEGVGTEEPASTYVEGPLVQPESAAHAPHVIGIHIGIDEVRKVRNAVLCSHLPDGLVQRILPREVLGDIVSGNRKGKGSSARISLAHGLCKGLVEHVHLVLEILVRFILDFAADYDGLVFDKIRDCQIEGDVRKGSLKTDPGGHVHVEEKLLQRLFDLSVVQPIVTNKGSNKGIEVGKCLGTGGLPLKRVEEVHHLHESNVEVLGRTTFDLPPDTCKTRQQQVLQVPTYTVGSESANVVDVELSPGVGIPDLFRVDTVEPVIANDPLSDVHIKALEGVGHVAVLPDPPVHLLQIIIDDGDVSKKLCYFSYILMLFPVQDVGFGRFGVAVLDQGLLDEVLHVLHGRKPAGLVLSFQQANYLVREVVDPAAVFTAYSLDRQPDRFGDLALIETDDSTIALPDLFNHLKHKMFPSQCRLTVTTFYCFSLAHETLSQKIVCPENLCKPRQTEYRQLYPVS